MDAIGALIANLHKAIGHDKAAAYLGQPPGDRADCVLCAYERQPDEGRRAAVIDAIGSRTHD